MTDMRGIKPPKTPVTEEILSESYDDLDSAHELLECIWMATYNVDLDQRQAGALRSVLEIAQKRVTSAKDRLHDTIAWVS